VFIFLIRSNIVKEHCERYIDGILANLNSAHSSRSVSYSLYRHKASTVCNCFVLINLFEQVGVFFLIYVYFIIVYLCCNDQRKLWNNCDILCLFL